MAGSRWKLTKEDSSETSLALLTDNRLVLLLILLISLSGAELSVPVKVVVPQGIESVNGSDVNMGCSSPLVDSGGVMVCSGQNTTSTNYTYLLDSISPAIDTNISEWASQLVTVREQSGIGGGISYPHVLMSFGFETAVSLKGIELDMFICHEWTIGAANIDVYCDETKSLTFRSISSVKYYASANHISQISCDSQTTITVAPNVEKNISCYTWHLVFDCITDSDFVFEWVHVGETRFLVEVDAYSSTSTSLGPSSVMRSLLPTMSMPGNASMLMKKSTISLTMTPTPSASAMPNATDSETHSTTPYKNSTTSIAEIPSFTVSFTQTSSKSPPIIGVGSPSRTAFPTPTDGTEGLLQLEFIAGIAGAVLVLLFICLIALVCIVLRCRSRAPRKAVPYDITRERNGNVLASADQNSSIPTNSTNVHTGNGHPVATTNSIIPLVENPMYEAITSGGDFYEQIPAELGALQTALNRRNDGSAPTANGFYDFAVSPENPTEASALIRDEGPSRRTVAVDNNDMYIEMMACTDRSLSPDLEQHLKQRPTLSEGIYSVPINPSDFVHDSCHQRPDSEQEVDFFTPVYPTHTVFPHGFKPTIEVSMENFKETKDLRIGHSRKTVLATTVGLSLKSIGLDKTNSDTSISIPVAVKKLKPHPSRFQREKEAFNRETLFMSQLKHPNVLQLLGVCYHDPAFVMMEYLADGDLNQFLERCSAIVPIITPSSSTQITTFTVISMASQIANGMKYLTELNFIHRDLATRNCFVGTNAVVKVADLGVDASRYSTHYYPTCDNIQLPIRWMATECFDGKYSKQSDVWAFGVTMWELFTLAKDVPYPHLSNEEVIQNTFAKGNRQFPVRPAACPQLVYTIMQQCWVEDVKERATFIGLHKMLQEHL